jgi:predicted ABC-class ATPase
MRAYRPAEVTAEAADVARAHPTNRHREGGGWRPLAARTLEADSLDPSKGRHAVHVRARTEERVLFGAEEVELSAVEQLVEAAQTRAMALALAWARRGPLDGGRPLPDGLHEVMAVLEDRGLDAFQEEETGELAAFRVFELAALLGRVRGARMRRLD